MAIRIPGLDKTVGKLVSSIIKQGGKAADDVVRVVGKKGAKVVDDLPFSRVSKEVENELTSAAQKEAVAKIAATTRAAKAAKPVSAGRFAFQQARARYPKLVNPLTLTAATAGGLFTVLGRLGKEDKPENISVEDWNDILATTRAGGTPVLDAEGNVLDYYGQLAKAEQDRYNRTTFVPQSTAGLDAQASLAQQYGASTADAMQQLAGEYAQAAGGIRQRGEAGASAINDIYGQGASAMDALAAAPSDGMGGMIPVSGEEALAGQYSQAQGQSLADYLRSSGLIDSEAAGQLAGFTQLLGPAYQDQYNLLNQQARNAFTARQAERLADFEMAKNERLQDALAEIEIQRALDSRAASSVGFDPSSVPQLITQWEAIKDDDTLKAYYESEGVTNLQEFIQYQIIQGQRAAQAG